MVVLSRSFHPSLSGMDVNCVKIDLALAPDAVLASHVRGSALVIAATSDEGVNNRLVAICRKEGTPCNNAHGFPGDVIIPAMVRGKEYCIAITTWGKSPAVSRYVRERIEREFSGLDEMIVLQHALRAELKGRVADQDERARILAAVLEDNDIQDVLGQGVPGAVELALRKYCP